MKKLALVLLLAAMAVPAAFGCCGRGYWGGYSYYPVSYGYWGGGCCGY